MKPYEPVWFPHPMKTMTIEQLADLHRCVEAGESIHVFSDSQLCLLKIGRMALGAVLGIGGIAFGIFSHQLF